MSHALIHSALVIAKAQLQSRRNSPLDRYAIFLRNPDGIIVYACPYAEALFGRSSTLLRAEPAWLSGYAPFVMTGRATRLPACVPSLRAWRERRQLVTKSALMSNDRTVHAIDIVATPVGDLGTLLVMNRR